MRLLKHVEEGNARKRRKGQHLTAEPAPVGGGGAEVNDELLAEEGGEEAELEGDPQGVPRTFFPLVDETPVEDDLVDDADEWVDNFEEGNGIQVDVGVENTEVISPEHDDARWFNEQNARDFFLRKAPEDFDIMDFFTAEGEASRRLSEMAPGPSRVTRCRTRFARY